MQTVILNSDSNVLSAMYWLQQNNFIDKVEVTSSWPGTSWQFKFLDPDIVSLFLLKWK